MARVLKQSKTIIGSTSSSSWTWKQVINEYFEEDSSNSNYYIQNFKNSNDVFNRNLSSFSEKELVEMKNKINNKNIYFRDL